jgi:hypothetical protein
MGSYHVSPFYVIPRKNSTFIYIYIYIRLPLYLVHYNGDPYEYGWVLLKIQEDGIKWLFVKKISFDNNT